MFMLNIGKFPWSVICFQNHSQAQEISEFIFPVFGITSKVSHITISSELELQTLGDQSISSRDLSTLGKKR